MNCTTIEWSENIYVDRTSANRSGRCRRIGPEQSSSVVLAATTLVRVDSSDTHVADSRLLRLSAVYAKVSGTVGKPITAARCWSVVARASNSAGVMGLLRSKGRGNDVKALGAVERGFEEIVATEVEQFREERAVVPGQQDQIRPTRQRGQTCQEFTPVSVRTVGVKDHHGTVVFH
jgi:hypothetical protein